MHIQTNFITHSYRTLTDTESGIIIRGVCEDAASVMCDATHV